ncbi:MAG: hypothetical protein RMJ17_02840 [Candidatus Aenigmarchaeota archaeon]|nr:hypothetical protein [Candidatus Aenigmarchaeota archaeon]MDW8149503.1 hypothetical protein [Candidatus Aenigmarchaeota archaeon]
MDELQEYGDADGEFYSLVKVLTRDMKFKMEDSDYCSLYKKRKKIDRRIYYELYIPYGVFVKTIKNIAKKLNYNVFLVSVKTTLTNLYSDDKTTVDYVNKLLTQHNLDSKNFLLFVKRNNFFYADLDYQKLKVSDLELDFMIISFPSFLQINSVLKTMNNRFEDYVEFVKKYIEKERKTSYII